MDTQVWWTGVSYPVGIFHIFESGFKFHNLQKKIDMLRDSGEKTNPL